MPRGVVFPGFSWIAAPCAGGTPGWVTTASAVYISSPIGEVAVSTFRMRWFRALSLVFSLDGGLRVGNTTCREKVSR